MSSLWTPDGERPVNPASPSPNPPAGSDPSRESTRPSGRPEGTIDPAQEAEYRAEMERLEEELLNAPVGDVIANHCYGLFQLAAIHLGQEPPHLEAARLAIDALGAIVERLGERIGPSATTLSEGLAQVRLAFVQISAAHASPEHATPGASTSSEPA
ncbi:MAG TPA: hypothetical protein VMU99_00620 [Acidimicrobiales bacterium]|nr:hypothetical protein [Acidimicrobiales bacterium]